MEKFTEAKKAAFSRGSESAAVISAGFIICFFGLGIEVEKCYQMYLLNFEILSLLKKLELILCSFLSGDVKNLAYGKKNQLLN